MDNKLNYSGIIENLIISALETQHRSIQENNYSDMREENIKRSAENTSKIIALQKAIGKLLPPEGQKMFMELDDLNSENLSIEGEYMFKKGVIMGLTTLGYLKETSDYIYLASIKL